MNVNLHGTLTIHQKVDRVETKKKKKKILNQLKFNESQKKRATTNISIERRIQLCGWHSKTLIMKRHPIRKHFTKCDESFRILIESFGKYFSE